MRIVGSILVVAGAAALLVGSFTYTEETHEADVGPLSLELKEKETVRIPTWAGVAAIVVGVGLLLYRRRTYLRI